VNQEDKYSYCETIAAYVWHIRRLTAVGRKLSGGADTLALCKAKVLWDLNFPINLYLLRGRWHVPRMFREI
jgi:hypothetical protein